MGHRKAGRITSRGLPGMSIVDATKGIEILLGSDSDDSWVVQADREYISILRVGASGNIPRAMKMINDFHEKYGGYKPHRRGLAPNKDSEGFIKSGDPLKKEKIEIREHLRNNSFWSIAQKYLNGLYK